MLLVENQDSPSYRIYSNRDILSFNIESLQEDLAEIASSPSAKPLLGLMEQTVILQSIIDKFLTRVIIQKNISEKLRGALAFGLITLDTYRSELVRRFEDQNIPDYTGEPIDENYLNLTANRLMRIASLSDTPYIVKSSILRKNPCSVIFCFMNQINGVMAEALATLPLQKKIVGFSVSDAKKGQNAAFLVHENDGTISAIHFNVTSESQENLDLIRQKQNILIATEGDIAGHATRALMTATGLKGLGYNPRIIGSGYFMSFLKDEGFFCLSPFTTSDHEERERLIAQLRGEKFGLFPWGFDMVGSKIKRIQEIFTEYIQSGLDLLVSDMDPITTIALERLGERFEKPFISVGQIHDMSFSPKRPLRSLKIKNIPIGRWSDEVRDLAILKRLDPKQKIYSLVFKILQETTDFIAGLPLMFHDRLSGLTLRKGLVSRRRYKFTDYLYGKDGTLFFSLDSNLDKTGYHYVGLQSGCRRIGTKNIDVARKPFIFNSQGSTYNQKTWEVVIGAVVGIPNSYSIHTTGKKEEIPKFIFREGESRPAGKIVGYVDGFYLSSQADVVINQGGFGTISQWLISNAERLIKEREVLKSLLPHTNTIEINEYLGTVGGVSRSISVCNTFEQENNARVLHNIGGNNVCSLLIADELLELQDPAGVIKDLVGVKLTAPVDDIERKFWIHLIDRVTAMNASIHSALILERIMFMRSWKGSSS